MPVDLRKMTIPGDTISFLNPIPRGSIQVGGIEECICDYDFYRTGDDSRANGCGGVYYQRYYLDSQKDMHCERTPCQCMIPILQQREDEKQRQEIQSQKDILFQKCQYYFGQYDLMHDETHAHMTLDRFKPGHTSQGIALEELKRFKVGKDGICLYGDSGRGKTHLALGIAHQASQQGYICLALKSIDLLNRIKRTYDKKEDGAEYEIIHTLKNVDLLVIDEVGIEKTTEWVTAKFYEVIDYRHKRRSTVFTTNFTGKQLKEKVGMAQVSRMWGTGMRFEIEGKDWRVA